jgi:hypothetical protein
MASGSEGMADNSLSSTVALANGMRHVLPDHHLDAHSKDIVRLGCALIGTITGLVLGLLINSAKNSFDAKSAQRFVATHAAVDNSFNVQRHMISRPTLRRFRAEAVEVWNAATAATV